MSFNRELAYLLAIDDGFTDATRGRPRRDGSRLELTDAQREGYEEGYRKGLESAAKLN